MQTNANSLFFFSSTLKGRKYYSALFGFVNAVASTKCTETRIAPLSLSFQSDPEFCICAVPSSIAKQTKSHVLQHDEISSKK